MPARAVDFLHEQAVLEELADVVAEMEPLERAHLIRGLAPPQRRVVEIAVARRFAQGWRASPAAMARHLRPGERKPWRYVNLLSDKFVEAFTGVDPRQLWSMPSQMGKTTNLVEDGVPWALQLNPRLRIMYVTFDAEKAAEEGGKVRDFINEHESDLGFRLKDDRRARAMWRTDSGGGLYCVGVHGGIIGWPAEAVLGDDLIGGWQKAHSETERAAVWAIYTSQMRMRIQNRSNPIILAGTRWHEDDPIGRAFSGDTGENWTYVRLPARAEPYIPTSLDPLLRIPDPLGRAPGEVIEPERFDDAEVTARAASLGSYLAAGLEQQRPAPEEGNDIKRAWFQLEDSLPPAYDDAITSWDLKLKDQEAGDYVVGGAWGRTGPELWLREVLRGQWDQATATNAIALMQVRHPEIRRHYLEAAGNAPEIRRALTKPEPTYELDPEMAGRLGMTEAERDAVQELRRRGMQGLLMNVPKGDKRVRMRAHSGVLEALHVHLPAYAAWVPMYLDEMASFPNGSFDDQVDMTSQALLKLSTMTASVRAAKGTVPGAVGRRARPRNLASLPGRAY